MAHVQKRNGKWQARYRGPDGRERTRRFDRKVDAESWLDTNGADIRRGAWVDPVAGQISLKAYANQWLGDRSDLRATTAAKYRNLLDLHLLPSLGSIAMANLSPPAVRRWHSVLTQAHPATAAGAYRLLSAICRTALADEVIARSPCRVVGGGVERSPKRPTATVAELAAAVESVPDRWRLALLLASWCQLRRAEILGLQRRDVDMLHGMISIERTWTAVAGKSPVVGPPKTDAGRRRVAVPPNVNDAFDHHLSNHVGSAPNAWLFPGEAGTPAHPRTLGHVWSKARLVVGRPDLHLHDLRHSGLTWAAATGASTAELMRRAGHASPQAALRYQHATEDRDRVLANALASLSTAASITTLADAADKLRTAEPDGGPAPVAHRL